MNRSRLLGALALLSVTACDGLKEALTAHVDVVARAGSQELSVQKLAEMLGKSRVPVRKEVAQQIADAWVNYQLLAQAASKADSISDVKIIDSVMWPVFMSSKTNKFHQQLTASWKLDTTSANMRAAFDKGDLLAARHILFTVPAGQAQTGSDSILKKAEAVRARATTANFAALAKQYGSDGTKDVGGDLGVFPPQSMVPQFSQAVKALKPGEIGPLVKTQFGYHIVRRSTFDEVKDAFAQQYAQRQKFLAESLYISTLEKNGKIEMKPNMARAVKEVGQDPNAHVGDRTVIATSRLGNFTTGDVARWIQGFPNPEQIRAQIAQAPDSLMKLFITNLVRNELVLDDADKAKVSLDSNEVNEIRKSFRAIVTNAWAGLGIAPTMLADSAKTPADRERLAATRVDTYVNRLVLGEEQYVEVPSPLVQALHKKYDWKVNVAGLDRAVQAAQPIRAKEDSVRAANTPQSAVPMPGGPPTPDTGKKPQPQKK